MSKKDAFNQVREEEIWSEYFRVKNRLMDYDENFDMALANIRMILKMRSGQGRLPIHYAIAQKHLNLILNLGRRCGAIPADANQVQIQFIENILSGQWKGVEDFEKARKYITEWYISTNFYNVTRERSHMLAPHEL
jgi:hypothetical protein